MNNESFDGQIVSVIDMDMLDDVADPIVNRNSYFFDHERGTRIPSQFWITVLLSHTAALNDPDNPQKSARLDVERSNIIKLFDGYESEVIATIGQVHEIILHGRIKMSLLLNSDGGDVGICRMFDQIIRHIQNNGGRVDAYMGEKAYSAAALLFLLADKRFAHENSALLVHKAYDDVTGKDVEEGTYGSFKHWKPILRAACPPENWDKLNRYIRRQLAANQRRFASQNPEDRYGRVSDIVLSARILARYDISEVFGDVDGLIDKFLAETGIDRKNFREEMRKVHALDRPSANIEADELEPSAVFYVNALGRRQGT